MELMIPLSSQDPRPLYEQIYQYIKGEIRNGGLKPMKKTALLQGTGQKPEGQPQYHPVGL